MNKIFYILLVIIIILGIGYVVLSDNKTSLNKNIMHNVKIETNKGTIVFETYDTDAPKIL